MLAEINKKERYKIRKDFGHNKFKELNENLVIVNSSINIIEKKSIYKLRNYENKSHQIYYIFLLLPIIII